MHHVVAEGVCRFISFIMLRFKGCFFPFIYWIVFFFFLVSVQKQICDVWQPTLTIVQQTATRKGREKGEGGEKAILLFSVLRFAA